MMEKNGGVLHKAAKNNNNKGYTLIEVVVVISIVALLAASIGINGLFKSRNIMMRNQLAEDLAAEIRLAKSYALGSTEVDTASGSFIPKAAIIHIKNYQSSEVLFLKPGASSACGTSNNKKKDVRLDGRGEPIINIPGSPSVNEINLVFSAPYGRFYLAGMNPSFDEDVNQSCKVNASDIIATTNENIEIKIKIDHNDASEIGTTLLVNKNTGEVSIKE